MRDGALACALARRAVAQHITISLRRRVIGAVYYCNTQRIVPITLLHRASYSSAASTPEPKQPTSQNTPQGPLAIYRHRVEDGILQNDSHQLETVKVLDALYNTLIKLTPPPLLDPIAGLDPDVVANPEYAQRDLVSPDFDWHNAAENRTVFGRVWSTIRSAVAPANPARDTAVARTAFTPYRGPRGLYLFGDVGSGKTMVMDLFYEALPIARKRRIHFHAFMQDVHRRHHELLSRLGMAADVIPAVANELANDAWVLCFDEFQVVDITDAMLLRRLLNELFNRGVVIVLTSNRPPDELYKNGIQRESFLSTIQLLKDQNIVWQLDSGIDYRKVESIKLNVYFMPLNSETDKKIDRVFDKLTDNLMVIPTELKFLGRTLRIEETAEEVAKIDFADICGQPHSAADYLELTRHFHTIVLKNVPKMTLNERDSARRFITLIDTIYDAHGKLVISAAVELDQLFVDNSTDPNGNNGSSTSKSGSNSMVIDRSLIDDLKLKHPSDVDEAPSIFTGTEEIFAFRRSLSRLNEMRNVKWLGEDFRAKLLAAD